MQTFVVLCGNQELGYVRATSRKSAWRHVCHNSKYRVYGLDRIMLQKVLDKV